MDIVPYRVKALLTPKHFSQEVVTYKRTILLRLLKKDTFAFWKGGLNERV